MPLRVSAISFLNPAPLLYNFEHEPTASELRTRYDIAYTTPAQCAAQLHAGAADLGLIPIAELDEHLAIVPGCTIASTSEVRSILLLVKNPHAFSVDEALHQVRTVAADSASRSSLAYAKVLFAHFHGNRPGFVQQPAEPLSMLEHADAALLIGDPALLAREHRQAIDAAQPHLLWLDLAQLWRDRTGLPWVAAVWAVRPEALGHHSGVTAQQLIDDTNNSRIAGKANVETLVAEWAPRIGLPDQTVRTYLTQNIHYDLDDDCLRAIQLFRKLAAGIDALPPLNHLPILASDELASGI
ncbi:chorismate dehydratase [Bryocella elongata]|uniref:Chorismate dehydratase n=1 Tax=Bryocella elongata TaxID=863522 RepID=A0A1H5SWS1_9BACT|nr:menaquinone biosynthesis protein [Bryocella elongata]SEF54227.1 chorismate dehydratase [Bryocella elongata]